MLFEEAALKIFHKFKQVVEVRPCEEPLLVQHPQQPDRVGLVGGVKIMFFEQIDRDDVVDEEVAEVDDGFGLGVVGEVEE